ncbi:MAG TPA: glycosyltransferase family 2 protein [Candidatus Sulfomarinibacteraceae bacterium]|nr:glycosyltransferase family 2 protein [Candidatus Sulfomarinibacteraceae bacterium]
MPGTVPTDAGSGRRMASGDQELTAIILTLNEADHITDCVASLGWADRVFVLDSHSDDSTVELARAAGADVAHSRFENYAQQRNAALNAVETDWVLFVDADERGTSELGQEIRQVMAERTEEGWYVPRHNYIFGRLTLGAGWYPDYQLRLFRHGCVRYERPVHEVAIVDGEVGYLQNVLRHYNYRDESHFHQKQRRYTEYDARILQEQGIRPKFYTPFTQPLRHFWWRFVSLKGYRDGLHGLRLSLYMAYYEWLKYRKLASLT